MQKLGSVRLRTALVLLISINLIIMISTVLEVNFWFTLVLLLWFIMLICAIDCISENIVMVFFLISFFVFLLGREFIYDFFGEKRAYRFLDIVNNQTFIILLISLIGICLGSKFVKSNIKVILSNNHIFESSIIQKFELSDSLSYSIACRLMFFLCYFFSIISVAYQIVFVRTVGYVESYASDSGGAGIPSMVSYISAFTPVILSMYLATCQSKKKVFLPIIMYEIYAVLTLLTGKRYPFIGISMYILTYCFLRHNKEGGWIRRWYYAVFILVTPVLMVFVTAYDSIRVGHAVEFETYISAIKEFFVQQGGSVNVIRRTIYNATQLKDMKFVSFSNIYSVLFENLIIRRLFGIEIYSGNSLEHALLGNSLAHRLSYYAYGNAYLAGRGVGSSFIAELFHDFSYIGVFWGSFFYGVLIEKVNKITFDSPFKTGILLAVIYYIYLSPRGSFDAFIGGIFNIYSMVLYLFTLSIANVINRKYVKNNK